MSFDALVLRVFIASPSDVAFERDEITAAIFDWNHKFAEHLGVILLPARWERDTVPAYRGNDPQQLVNEQIVNKCDILVGVFWTKLGTPTEGHLSGTLEEIDIFIKSGKEVLLYFLDKPLPRDGLNYEELAKVDAYKKEYQGKGLYAKYDPNVIQDHLYRKVMELKKINSSESENAINDTRHEESKLELVKVPVFKSNTEVINVRQFWESRIAAIRERKTIIPLVNELDSFLCVHLVPHQNHNLEVPVLKETAAQLVPFYTTGWDYKFNIHGFMTFAKWPDAELAHSYVQIYKSGCIESVDNGLLKGVQGKKVIPSRGLEEEVIEHSFKYISAQKQLGIGTPLSIYITLLNIKGFRLGVQDSWGRISEEEFDMDDLHLPETVVHGMPENMNELARHFRTSFDILWNAFGWPRSSSFDEQGQWKGRIR
ncbi:hypothetical protein [Paenibacillus sp. WC2504]|uniref:hypothetical protein n=1 Tax=Paenibacillus sp. WC2504 TaxID=3461403 RepID=UPI004045A6DE